jgi:hypothetical protein
MKTTNKFFELVTKSPILIGIIMLEDLYKLVIEIFDKITLKTETTMNIDYFNFITKLLMAIALVIVFRQYYAMKKQTTLSKLFNYALFESLYKDKLNKLSYDRNEAIKEIKDKFYDIVFKKYKDDIKQPEIQKMVDEYFNYQISAGDIL